MAGLHPPSAEVASTGGVAQAEVGAMELSRLPTPSIPGENATQQRSGNSPSSGSNLSRRTSATWTIVGLPFVSTFYSLGYKSSDYIRRHKTSIYKNLLKVLGVFCGLGALILAWIALKSPMNPNDIDIQSLAAMNKTYEVLQESLSKLREELANERRQVETDRELLRNEANQLDLQRWTARRQFIKDCLDYHEKYNITSVKCTHAIKAWDEPPPSLSETTFSQVVRRRPQTRSPYLDISQTPFAISAVPFVISATPFAISATPFAISATPSMTSGLLSLGGPHLASTRYVQVTTSQESPGQSPKEQPPLTNTDPLPKRQIRYPDRSLTYFMTGFITFVAVSLIRVYMVRLLRTNVSAKQTVFSRSEKTRSTESPPCDVYPAVIRNKATSDDLPVGNRNRRATSTRYKKGDI